MTPVITIRTATRADIAAVDDLLQRSYTRLLAPDYPPSVRVMAVPRLIRARPELLASGRYFVATDGAAVIGAGGWSGAAPGVAEVRHVATDPAHLRRGVARAILLHVLGEVAAAGAVRLDCLATRTGVPFYLALGFTELGPVEMTLGPGIGFPVVRMMRAV